VSLPPAPLNAVQIRPAAGMDGVGLRASASPAVGETPAAACPPSLTTGPPRAKAPEPPRGASVGTTESSFGERGATAAARTRAMAVWSTAVYSPNPGRATGACAAAHRSVCGRAGNQGAAQRLQGACPTARAALERRSRPPASAAGLICTAGGANRVL
jgi:hypothetical protein